MNPVKLIKYFFNVDKGIKNAKKAGKEIVSYKHTYAAFNLIKIKTENRIFVFSLLVSLIFLGFYGYLIYLNVDVYSLRHIIIYSILSALLLVSLVFNIFFHPIRKMKMSSKEKKKRKNILEIEKNIVMLIQALTKIASLGFMLFEIITIDSSLKRLLPFGFSTLALILQVLITYISRLFIYYYEILLVGIDKDIKNSGIIDILSDNNVIKDPINVSTEVNDNRVNKISDNISQQIDIDKSVSAKNKKDFLFEITKYCLVSPRKKEDIIFQYKLSPSIANNQLDKLINLGIIKINVDTTIEMLITNVDKIKELIYQ